MSAGPYSAGKATDDDLSDLFGAFNEQQEEEEDGSEAAETDSTSSSGSDLIVQVSSKSDSPLTPGQFFTLVVLVRNQGDGQATTTLTYYRSTDATISVSDTKVGTDAVDALATGFSLKSIRLAAPSSGGTYYYGACVASVAGESNTDNNCSSSMAVTVRSGSSPVSIPDAELRAAIVAELGKASGATIYKSEMETLTRLDLEGEAEHADISDLTGLEFATKLSSLNLAANNITDISPLSSLTKLSSLNLAANNIRGDIADGIALQIEDFQCGQPAKRGDIADGIAPQIEDFQCGQPAKRGDIADGRVIQIELLQCSQPAKHRYIAEGIAREIEICQAGQPIEITGFQGCDAFIVKVKGR